MKKYIIGVVIAGLAGSGLFYFANIRENPNDKILSAEESAGYKFFEPRFVPDGMKRGTDFLIRDDKSVSYDYAKDFPVPTTGPSFTLGITPSQSDLRPGKERITIRGIPANITQTRDSFGNMLVGIDWVENGYRLQVIGHSLDRETVLKIAESLSQRN